MDNAWYKKNIISAKIDYECSALISQFQTLPDFSSVQNWYLKIFLRLKYANEMEDL